MNVKIEITKSRKSERARLRVTCDGELVGNLYARPEQVDQLTKALRYGMDTREGRLMGVTGALTISTGGSS